MEYKILNTGDYLIIVDDSEIKGGDWYIDLNLKQIFSKSNPQISKIEWQKKIIGHLPLNNSPILESVDLLPPIEDESESLSLKSVNKRGYTTDDYQDGFEDGYNKSKEKYKYTEEDLRKVIDKTIHACNKAQKESYGELVIDEDEIIQSLQQPKMPVGFKCETERKLVLNLGIDIYNPNTHVYSDEPKTTTNSQGFTQLVGEYIY
jgi:hypothetical protein